MYLLLDFDPVPVHSGAILPDGLMPGASSTDLLVEAAMRLACPVALAASVMAGAAMVSLPLKAPASGNVAAQPQSAAIPAPAAAKRFVTEFAQAEQPVSSGGAWHHRGRFWAVVRTVAGHAVSTQTGQGRYDDAYAYLDGFAANQTAQATLWIDPAARGAYRELELLLRWTDTGERAWGYECNLSWNGAYAEIVRWNGPPGDFTYIARQTHFPPGLMPPRTGDVLTAKIRGGSIAVHLNRNDGRGDQLLLRGADQAFQVGNPGMGFYIEGPVDPTQFGFSHFAAWSD